MKLPFLGFVALFLAGLSVRVTYERLKKAGKVVEGDRRVVGVVFVAMAALWVSWFAMCPLDPFRVELPASVRWSGLSLVVLGWLLALGALVQLGGVENIDHLVTTGVFSRLRHPMYTGFVLWIAGWATFHGATVSFLAGALCLANILHWRRLEEAKLEAAYGEAYLTHRRSTWF